MIASGGEQRAVMVVDNALGSGKPLITDGVSRSVTHHPYKPAKACDVAIDHRRSCARRTSQPLHDFSTRRLYQRSRSTLPPSAKNLCQVFSNFLFEVSRPVVSAH